MSPSNNFRCETCLQFYSTKFSLRRHIKVKHTPKKSCDICGEPLPSEKLLSKHMETHEQMKKRLKCPLCSYVSHFSVKLNEHIKCSHGITIDVETHQFKSSEEFFKWKNDIEKNETSKFVKYCGNSKIKDGSTRSYYYCHRSYVYKPHVVNRMKKLKKQGFAKIGAHCPASMKVINKRDGSVKVHYIKTHLGHEKEMCYINLSKDERKYLASLISKNISFDQILSDIKNGNDLNNKSGKLKYITRADLHNIRRSFNLYNNISTCNNRDDLLGTNVWVKQHLGAQDSCILFHKPQGVNLDNNPNLPNNEFFLAVMTKDQETALIQHDINCVCLDIIHSTNINDRRFELVSLYVMNNARQEFPAAFLITTKADVQNIEIFLTLIKDKIGILTTNIFLSNMKDCCYNIWCKVMKIPQLRLYCSWEVNRCCRLAIQKINSPEDESSCCEIVKELFEESNINVFNDKLENSLRNLCTNSKTRRFGEYFEQTFATNAKSWAYCYRKNVGMITDIQFERIHRTMKYLFISVKTLKRVDKSIIEIIKFIQDKFFNKCKTLIKEVRILKMREIDNRHRASMRLNLESVVAVDHGWKVNSKSRISHSYTIHDILPNCNCTLICGPCKVCIHRFCCSCNDSSVMWRMCKHIHLLCRTVTFTHPPKETIQTQPIVQNNKENENLLSDSQFVNQFLQIEFNSTGLDGLVESICLNRPPINTVEDSIEQKKTILKRKFFDMLEMIKTENEANLLQSSLDFLIATLSGNNNDSLDICPPTELFNDTIPSLNSSLVLINKPSGPKVNNISFNVQQVAQNQYASRAPIDYNNSVPPLPPLVPLKSKNSPSFILLNQKEDISSPFTVQFLGLEQESAEQDSLKSGNVLILMNKTINSENG